MSVSKVTTRESAGKSAASAEEDKLPAVGLADIARHLESLGTPKMLDAARILSGVSKALFDADTAPTERERARARKLLKDEAANFYPRKGPGSRNLPTAALKGHEAIRDAARWMRGWLSLLAEGTPDAPTRADLSMWTKPPEGPAISEEEAVSKVFHAVAELGIRAARKHRLKVDGVHEQLVDHLRRMAKHAESGRLAPKDAPRIIEWALVLAGMPEKKARAATTILRKRQPGQPSAPRGATA